ncbi:hypothetical protein LT493_20850 [Streptomyces tricolor]|nr:hypothetical protein [Streptomyces tricolor]
MDDRTAVPGAALFDDPYPSRALEAGKFFPATQGGLTDPVQPADVACDTRRRTGRSPVGPPPRRCPAAGRGAGLAEGRGRCRGARQKVVRSSGSGTRRSAQLLRHEGRTGIPRERCRGPSSSPS